MFPDKHVCLCRPDRRFIRVIIFFFFCPYFFLLVVPSRSCLSKTHRAQTHTDRVLTFCIIVGIVVLGTILLYTCSDGGVRDSRVRSIIAAASLVSEITLHCQIKPIVSSLEDLEDVYLIYIYIE